MKTLLLLAATTVMFAQNIQVPVHHSTPVYSETVTYEEQCHTVTRKQQVPCGESLAYHRDNGWGQLIGSTLGGVSAYQIHGNTEAKIAAAVGGALLGGYVGRHMNEGVRVRPHYCTQHIPTEVCNKVPKVHKYLSGWNNYAYHHGEEIVIRSSEPIEFITLHKKHGHQNLAIRRGT